RILVHVRRAHAKAARQRHLAGGHRTHPSLSPLLLGRSDEAEGTPRSAGFLGAHDIASPSREAHVTRARLLALTLIASAASAVVARPSVAVERNLAGSAQ